MTSRASARASTALALRSEATVAGMAVTAPASSRPPRPGETPTAPTTTAVELEHAVREREDLTCSWPPTTPQRSSGHEPANRA
jgi:hypothetical protein